MGEGVDTERRRKTWVATTYFAEGLPYMVIRYLAGVWLTDIGLREAHLGFLNFLNLPWNAKFLWAPAVDLVATRRRWLVGTQAILVVAGLLMAALVALGPAPLPVLDLPPGSSASAVLAGHAAATAANVVAAVAAGSWPVLAFVVLLVASAFVAATHDVAIDGYYMTAIVDPVEQAAWTGLRVMAYRGAVIFTKSVLVALAGWFAWVYGFLGAAFVLFGLLVFHRARLPHVEAPREGSLDGGALVRGWGRAFVTWLDQPRVGLVVFFVVTYKLGDEVLFSMNTPFLLRELDVTKEQLAWLSGVVGTVASIGGTLSSAWAIQRWGLRRAIWPLTVAMNVNIWAYVWLAWALPDATTTGGIATIAAVHAYEQFAAGLGNAVLVVYLMRTCKPEFKAGHYAIASALSSLGGTLFGGFGGVIVEQVGYLWLYVLAFLAALPAMAILPFVPLGAERPRPRDVAPAG